MDGLIGKNLQEGKYIIEQELGRGGFGITFLATHSYLGQRMVIKTLNESLRQHPNFREFQRKFQDEARRLALCVHPNIVRVNDFFLEDGLPYMVMDYIPGKNLANVVLPNKPLSEAIAINYIRQIGEALKLVHQKGLLHRDIKPQNILLHEDTLQVILIDFGIAREFNPDFTQAHTNMVTDGYAPIEQYLPEGKFSPATDIYGIAATLYTLLTAQIPVAATIRDRSVMPTPKDLQPQLSYGINEAVMRGMALEIRDRPTTVDAWLNLLPNSAVNLLSNSQNITPPPAVVTPATQGETMPVSPHYHQPALIPDGNNNYSHNNNYNNFSLVFLGIIIAIATGITIALASFFLNKPLQTENTPIANNTELNQPNSVENYHIPNTPIPAETPKNPPKNIPKNIPKQSPKISITPTNTPIVTATPKPPEIQVQPSLPPDKTIFPSDENKSPQNSETVKTIPTTIPGYPIGTSEKEIKAKLGEPTKTNKGLWPNTRTAIYDLEPNRITLGYIYDQNTGILRQTEVSFGQSVDRLQMQVTVNGMLGNSNSETILQELDKIHQRKSNQYVFRRGKVAGIIERNNSDRIYIAIWDTNLH